MFNKLITFIEIIGPITGFLGGIAGIVSLVLTISKFKFEKKRFRIENIQKLDFNIGPFKPEYFNRKIKNPTDNAVEKVDEYYVTNVTVKNIGNKPIYPDTILLKFFENKTFELLQLGDSFFEEIQSSPIEKGANIQVKYSVNSLNFGHADLSKYKVKIELIDIEGKRFPSNFLRVFHINDFGK